MPFTEADFELRKETKKNKNMLDMENLVLSLKKENLKVLVVCAGILYGYGEIAFKNHFKAAWLQDPVDLPYLNDGLNKIPTIHI